MHNTIAIKSSALCCTDAELLRNFGLEGLEPDKTLLPAALRRRASLTTRLAITAAHHACLQAQADPRQLPSIFASVGGEIQVTDELCRALPVDGALISPTQFHNSVHNTPAGYWTILHGCQAPSTAIAALDDTFAIALLEAIGQLRQTPGDILLVCYDELWPQYLAPPLGKTALACALVLSTTDQQQELPRLSLPEIAAQAEPWDVTLAELAAKAPAANALPLLLALQGCWQAGHIPLNSGSPRWQTNLMTPLAA